MEMKIKAGFGRGTIHFPMELFPLEGFSGIHDNPHIRLMVLETETEQFALAAAELVNVPGHVMEQWRMKISSAFNMDADKIMIHMTHAITTPHEPGFRDSVVTDPETLKKRELYLDAVNAAADDAIRGAQEDLSYAYLGWGTGKCMANVSRDVETPFGWWIGEKGDGPSNHDMKVMKAINPDGSMKGIFVSYAMIPCAINNAGREKQERLISSEVCGAFCSKLEEKYHAPVLYAMSAAGDQVPVKMAQYECSDSEGNVKKTDGGVLQGLRNMEEVSSMMLESVFPVIEKINCKETIAEAGWKRVSFMWDTKIAEEKKPRRSMVYQAASQKEIAADMFYLDDAVLTAVRMEITTPVGELLFSQSPFQNTIILSMTNGESKYLPDTEAYEKATWEAQSSMFMPGGAEKLVAEILSEIQTI